MRTAISLLLALCACATDPADPADPGGAERIVIDTPSFTLQPGEEKFYCYYTTLPAAAPIGLARISSSMPAGSHHMIVFKTRTQQMPDGTLRECEGFAMGGGGGGLGDIPLWLFASQEPEGRLEMPPGVGLAVGANQAVVVNMHYINTGDAPLDARVHLEFEPYPSGATYTPAHTYVTYSTQIDVPPGQTGSAGGSCTVPAGAQFLTMSTHSHQYTTSARVRDGDRLVLETLDWAHATLARWPAPYFTFSSGKLDYRCAYTNTSDRPLTTGESAIANEMCMAVGVYFPATGDTFCLNSLTIQL